MLDIDFILKNRALVEQAIQNKGLTQVIDLDAFIKLDGERRVLIERLDNLRHQQNTITERIKDAPSKQRSDLIEEAGEIKVKIQELEEIYRPVKENYEKQLYQIPNVTAPKMPVGKDEDDNVVIREWGEIPQFDFEPQEHDVLAENLGLLDTKKAAEVAGARFYYLKGKLVLLQFALINWSLSLLTDREFLQEVIQENNLDIPDTPFEPMLPPLMIRNAVQKAIHRVHGDQTYTIEQDDLNLIASAEHTMAPYHMNEILDEAELPKRYVGYSTAFRREAGTYGKDIKGFFRNHQFDKVELESFTTAEAGEVEQAFMVAIQEKFNQMLGIPYQVVQICTGDTGKPDYNQFDINSWFPGQGRFRETHTSDYMTDYQTRGISAFYKNTDGDKKLLHTNDATAIAGRTLIAILENYQQEDGSILIPQVLKPFVSFEKIS